MKKKGYEIAFWQKKKKKKNQMSILYGQTKRYDSVLTKRHKQESCLAFYLHCKSNPLQEIWIWLEEDGSLRCGQDFFLLLTATEES